MRMAAALLVLAAGDSDSDSSRLTGSSQLLLETVVQYSRDYEYSMYIQYVQLYTYSTAAVRGAVR